jgi:uncharacterized oligopeptide transporter (OPT) family protein
MLDWVVDLLRVVPNYSFIVSVIAVAMSIYWSLAKLRQWRLAGIIQKLWDRRNKEIRFKKTQRVARGARANEIDIGR